MTQQTNITVDSLQPGDTVYFLREYRWERGEVIRVNQKTVTILGQFGFGRDNIVKIKKDKCAHPDEKITVVWEAWRGRNGRGAYRVEREQYPEHLVPAKSFKRPTYDYLTEIEVNDNVVLVE